MIGTNSPVHPASLVDPSVHSPAMLQLLETKVSRSLIGKSLRTHFLCFLTYFPSLEYVVDCVIDTVHYAMGRPSSSRGRSQSRLNENAKFTKFVTDVFQKAEVKLPVILLMLVYIDRAKPHLQIALEQWAFERVFLGALILANKVRCLLIHPFETLADSLLSSTPMTPLSRMSTGLSAPVFSESVTLAG